MIISEEGDYMLNVIRIIVVILGGISLILVAMDSYNFRGFKINSTTIQIIVYLTFILCAIFFSIDGFLIWWRSR